MATLNSLGERFALATTTVELGGRTLELVHPKSVDDLIDESEFNTDQRLPYWGRSWPSARILAKRIVDAEGQGRRLLELGCGVGLTSLAAVTAGFEVLVTDYYTDALEFVVANAERNQIGPIQTRHLDWRHYPDDLRNFDCIIASDVLYERANASLVAEALAKSLAPDGIALITDPGRRVAKPFAAECRRRGMVCDCVDLEEVIDGAMNCVVELFEIRRKAR